MNPKFHLISRRPDRVAPKGHDLGVLATALHRERRADPYACLDAMCRCGVRALRYLEQAGADFVDASDDLRSVIQGNLPRFEPAPQEGQRKWVVSHLDARRLLVERYLWRKYFDVIDVDWFDIKAWAAFLALKIGGKYLSSTEVVERVWRGMVSAQVVYSKYADTELKFKDSSHPILK